MIPAELRGLTLSCSGCGVAILSFDLADGSVLRVWVSAKAQADLRASLNRQVRGEHACDTCAVRDLAHPVPLVDFPAVSAGPDFVPRAQGAKGASRGFARRSAQAVMAACRAWLSRRGAGQLTPALEFRHPPLECFDTRRQGFQGFPDRHLVEEFENV
jgi:hypothetical protein